MARLPIDLTLRLPGPAWVIADPAQLDLPNAAFAALRPEPGLTFVPLITVSGALRDAGDSVEEVADESLTILAGQVRDATVLDRVSSGTATAPGVTQVLGGRATVRGEDLEMRQAQVVATSATGDADQQAVILFTLTCTKDQLPVAGPELQTFVASANPGGA